MKVISFLSLAREGGMGSLTDRPAAFVCFGIHPVKLMVSEHLARSISCRSELECLPWASACPCARYGGQASSFFPVFQFAELIERNSADPSKNSTVEAGVSPQAAARTDPASGGFAKGTSIQEVRGRVKMYPAGIRVAILES